MEYNLDYKVEVRKEDEFKSLFEWYIAEIDNDGNDLGFGEKLVPFEWGSYFKFKNLSLLTELNLDRRDPIFDKTDQKNLSEITKTESISGQIFPNNNSNEVKYSMLGTDREIEKFSIFIKRSNKQTCYLSGSPGYKAEFDFKDIYQPDYVQVNIGMPDDKFNEIAEGIKNKSFTSFYLSLTDIKGFYSDWSPEISTPFIKVLTRAHELEAPKDMNIKIDHLGDVGEFNLTMESTINFENKN